ncbi:MAG: FTR1 family protein [Nitrospinae bacterium]|nr:FTR1 family protein [Nitrospinota bacterium]
MTGGMLITFREGLEAFLVVGIILSYLSRSGLKGLFKWIFTGVGLGIVTAFVLAVGIQVFMSGFENSAAELYIKVSIMGFAVAVLSYMVIWMSRNSGSVKGEVERKLEQAISAGSMFALAFMAYLAVLREGFETVLFLGALYGESMGSDVFYGGLLGLALALAVTAMIFLGMKSLPLKTFFKITGGLIILIAAGLLANMIGIMQDISFLPLMTGHLFDIGWLLSDESEFGIFLKALFGYNSSPSSLQALAYLGYLAGAWFIFTRDHRGVGNEARKA